MNSDYKKHYYDVVKMTINKRVIIDNTLNKLHEMQLNMIDQAKEVIKNIIAKK